MWAEGRRSNFLLRPGVRTLRFPGFPEPCPSFCYGQCWPLLATLAEPGPGGWREVEADEEKEVGVPCWEEAQLPVDRAEPGVRGAVSWCMNHHCCVTNDHTPEQHKAANMHHGPPVLGVRNLGATCWVLQFKDLCEVAVELLPWASVSGGLTGAGRSTFQVARSPDCWQETSAPHHMGISRGLFTTWLLPE